MQKQRLQQNQQLKLSPQQIQFLSLLQIPVISLEKRIEEELEENPALEENEAEDWEEDYAPNYRHQQSDETSKPVIAEREETLQEFLLKQLPLQNLEEPQFQLAEFLIGCLDDNGFLSRELYAIADDLLFKQNIEVNESDLAPILILVQSLDPAGVGTRSLQECLLLQLQRKTATEAIQLAMKMLQQQYQAFSTKNFEKLQRELSVSKEALKSAFKEISKLNPKPGGSFISAQEGVAYITPDFILNTVSGTLNLQLNNKRNFRVGPSKQYQKMLSELKQGEDEEAIQFLKKKLESAQWFSDALKQRENTLLNTMNCIMELQTAFFKSGDVKDLKPMKLMDVAQKVKLNISTISRVTNSKYIETPFGTFLLKEFFSEAYSKKDGTTISTKVIKSHLQDILEKEDKRQPYTDEKLSELLDEIGYHIARRTVAKYREQLNFSVARLRKEL
jgi:RNA polymerase sigma-54 factor